jgi:hypothetical protein
MHSPHTQQMLKSRTARQHAWHTIRADVPRSLGFEPGSWCCQQIVQMKAAVAAEGGVGGYVVDSETGELAILMVHLGLPGEEEHFSVAGETGLCIVQRCRTVGEGMMVRFVNASMVSW